MKVNYLLIILRQVLNISFNRVAFIFFIFFGISIIFSVKSIYLGSLKKM